MIKIKIITGKYSKLYKCKECGYPYTKTHNRIMYCTKKCRTDARRDQIRINKRNYYKKYSFLLISDNRNNMGSSHLGKSRNKDFTSEAMAVRREVERLKIKV